MKHEKIPNETIPGMPGTTDDPLAALIMYNAYRELTDDDEYLYEEDNLYGEGDNCEREDRSCD